MGTWTGNMRINGYLHRYLRSFSAQVQVPLQPWPTGSWYERASHCSCKRPKSKYTLTLVSSMVKTLSFPSLPKESHSHGLTLGPDTLTFTAD